MRTEPFNIAPEAPVTEPAQDKPVRRSLADQLAKKAFRQTTTEEPKEEKTETTSEEPVTDKEKTSSEEPSGQFDDGDPEEKKIDDFEKEFKQQVTDEEAADLAEMIVEAVNGGRLFFGPSLYEGLAFPGQERNDIYQILEKAKKNETANKPADEGFSNYEKRLYEKWPKVRQDIENISYTEKERSTWAKHISKQIKNKGAAKFINEWMWLLLPFFYELKHGRNVIICRTTDAVKKKHS